METNARVAGTSEASRISVDEVIYINTVKEEEEEAAAKTMNKGVVFVQNNSSWSVIRGLF